MNRILFLFLFPVASFAQKTEVIDTTFISKIKEEGLKRSQVMNTMTMITDVYGPRLEDGTVLVGSATVPYPPDVPNDKRIRVYSAAVPKILPQIIVSAEHYNRLVRQILKGNTVKMELTLETEFTPSAQGFNIIAEIPGTDLKDEVVMIGAHFDSWHSGTGATDNAAGSAVMMEASEKTRLCQATYK